jgi:hypothetical protein
VSSAWLTFLRDKEIDVDAAPVVEAITRLRQQAKNLSDFQALNIKVTGSIVNPEDPSRSVAVINGKPFYAGDRLVTGGEVTVRAIRRDAVEFVFRGDSIEVRRDGARMAAGDAVAVGEQGS